MSSKKIFVGNLPWKARLEESLKALFEEHGEVISVKIITINIPEVKGFGFVEIWAARMQPMPRSRELNDKPYMERNLLVSLAQERAPREGGAGGPGAGRSFDRPDRGSRGSFGGGDRSGGDRGSRFSR